LNEGELFGTGLTGFTGLTEGELFGQDLQD